MIRSIMNTTWHTREDNGRCVTIISTDQLSTKQREVSHVDSINLLKIGFIHVHTLKGPNVKLTAQPVFHETDDTGYLPCLLQFLPSYTCQSTTRLDNKQ